MRRIAVILLLILIGFGATGAAGYYIHKQRIDPVYSLAERVELKLRRELGFRTDTEMAVERLRSLFLPFRGVVHVMPERDFRSGGALTIWGEDLLILHMSGKVFWLGRDQEEGMVLSDLTLPDNGYDGYARIAREKYPGRNARLGSLRYNDIEFVDTPERRGLLLSYTFVDVERECYLSRLAWLPLDDSVASIREARSAPQDWQIVYDTQPCLPFSATGELMLGYMAGGRVAYKDPGLVYWGSGEYHLDGIYRPDAGIQSDESDYGKVLEVDLAAGTARHFSKGHRNLQGMTLDAQGRVWTTEHGMRGGDELNLIREGRNYGWPLVDMGVLYNNVPRETVSGPGRHTDFTPPVYAWVPSAAVSTLALVDGFHPTWDGDLLIGSLKAGTLFRARIHGDRLVSLEAIKIGQRIRDVIQWGPDRIALWLDINEVVVLTADPLKDPLDGMAAKLQADGMEPALAERAVATLNGCAECHAYVAVMHGAGPSLAGVVDRNVAATAFGGYSEALRSLPGTWDRERLIAYLMEPEAVVEGTAMTGLGVGDRELAAALVAALAKIEAVGRVLR